MVNLVCPAEDIALLASVAREICPFPNYNPSPLFINMLSINSSFHLKNHYTAVQSSLTTKQLDDFTQSLRTTFGNEGKVTLGGVGVVALSLAVLFDTVARQARGESVSDSEPIPGLFMEDLRGYYTPQVYTISKYLRLVPHIANNPKRMIRETERYTIKLLLDDLSFTKWDVENSLPLHEDIQVVNKVLKQLFAYNLKMHFIRIQNTTPFFLDEKPPVNTTYNLNCDPWAVEKDVLAKIQQSDQRTQEAFENCKPKEQSEPEPWVQHVAKLVFSDAIAFYFSVPRNTTSDEITAQREDFDLKANALGKWA